MHKKTIYLAGPDVFRQEADIHFLRLKQFALHHQLEAFSPLDGSVKGTGAAMEIFRSNIQLIEAADLVVANLIPFRGLCVDDGTAFEIGIAFALKKTIYGYTSFAGISTVVLAAQFSMYLDAEYPEVEDFGDPCNLMITQAINASGGKILNSYEACIQEIAGL